MIEWAVFWLGLFTYWITCEILKYKSKKELYSKTLKLYSIHLINGGFEGFFTNKDNLEEYYHAMKKKYSHFKGQPCLIEIELDNKDYNHSDYVSSLFPKIIEELEM